MKYVMLALFLSVAGLAGAVEWKCLDAEHHLGGRKASEGYLRGKVVLVCRWSPSAADSKAMLVRMEEVWQSFKTKPFVLLGACADAGAAEAAKKLVTESAVTFSAYAGAALGAGEPASATLPYLYVVDETGKVVYQGKDDRDATQALATALTDLEAPRDLEQWRRFLDFELETLPGRAVIRAAAFRKKFPAEAKKKEYVEKFKTLAAVPEVKKLSELVAFSRKAKDMRAFSPKKANQKKRFASSIESAIEKYAPLAESAEPRVAQEAKNALADLKWALAAL